MFMALNPFSRPVLALVGVVLFVTACEGGQVLTPRQNRVGEIGKKYEETDPRPTVFGKDGITFGDSKKRSGTDSSGALGVNTYLWRASLDTIAFLPLSGAPDPFGGVIITDWYSPPETPAERFKLNVYILGRALRADGIRVSMFRQVYDANGVWRDAQVQPDAARKLEDAILTRARQLRNQTRIQNN